MNAARRAAGQDGAGVLRKLGSLPVQRFVERYWQKRALCVREALAGGWPRVAAEDLFALARDAQVESRLVESGAGGWSLRHGPFGARSLPARKRGRWTLLVQGVDLHDARLAEFAARFRFLPAARFDDVMISFATDGGGVGPHVDQYDVFLIQAQGRRRWRIARRYDEAEVPGLPLRVLARFEHEREWILEAGDLLYLPPGVAHEGVALGESITISVGFRLPAMQELAEAWTERQARAAPLQGRLSDGTRRVTDKPARLPASMVDDALRRLRRGLPSRLEMRRTLLEHLTEPKPTVIFSRPRPALGTAQFLQRCCKSGLRLDLRTRMLYEGGELAVNGELQDVPSAAIAWIRRLADHRSLCARDVARIAERGAEPFAGIAYSWYCFGWLHPDAVPG
jgi:50S ribosomal protein L16 3-hydroxylase